MSSIMALVKSSGVKIGIDPLGGAAVHYWQPIIEHYGINATIVNDVVDPTFRFMTADWDGKIRMDCSSPYAMAQPDRDARQVRRRLCQRHRRRPPRHRDAHRRPDEPEPLSSPPRSPICSSTGRNGARTPRSARPSSPARSSTASRKNSAASWSRRRSASNGSSTGSAAAASALPARRAPAPRSCSADGSVWTTDKDGVIMGLLAAEIIAKTGRDPSQLFAELTAELGTPFYERIDVPATPQQKNALKALDAGTTRHQGTGRRAGARRSGPRRPATISLRRHQGRDRATAGSPRGHRAPRTSTRSMPKVFAAKII